MISILCRPNAFEVVGVDGVTSGVVVCEDTRALAEWIQCISEGINHQFRNLVRKPFIVLRIRNL